MKIKKLKISKALNIKFRLSEHFTFITSQTDYQLERRTDLSQIQVGKLILLGFRILTIILIIIAVIRVCMGAFEMVDVIFI